VPRLGRVVLGGTFDRLHVGHEALLGTAFQTGRSVAIGVTTDGYLESHPKPDAGKIQPYRQRRAALRQWLSARYPASRWTIVPLHNTFGRSVEDGVDALVVSADTLSGGRLVNAERRRRGRKAVPLFVVPLVLGDDLQPVSSRRIRAAEIDRNGRRRSPIRVGLTVSAADRAPASRGIRLAFPRAIIAVRSPPRSNRLSPAQLRGAAGRAAEGAELGIAVGDDNAGSRSVAVASPSVVLEPRRLPRGSPGDLTRAMTALLRRSDRTKRFKHGRK
jgi:pantetheine-phosphate adenylyltransferase